MASSTGQQALRDATLRSLPAEVAVPTYERRQVQRPIVHLGVGGFHRAHQAVYLDDLAERRVTSDWGERGVGLLPGDQRMAAALEPQQCLYTVVERSAERDTARVVGSLGEYAFAPGEPQRVLGWLSDPATRIVSMTITEGGYLVDDKTGVFDAQNPTVEADTDAEVPKTAFGYLCVALQRRRDAGNAPFTVMSCDNLQGNGGIARTAVTSFARLRNDALANWIESEVAFPNAMVDRITPQTTDADRAMVAETFGIVDDWPVVTEPFKQWVLEDTFPNGRPPLEEVGVQIVPDVHPYETMKLRLLNGSHQAMAYLGYLAGYRYVHDAMADADLRRLIVRMMDEEITPLLPPVPGIDLTEYKHTWIERVLNPKIKDTLARLAFGGSDRMPKFLLPSIAEALAQGRPHHLLTLATVGWLRYLRGVDEQGAPIVLQDDRADELRVLANHGLTDPRPLLSVRRVFGDLGQNEEFVRELSSALRDLDARGARGVLSAGGTP
jgi:mannitol-1-phosphate/altronate dehydrogenase